MTYSQFCSMSLADQTIYFIKENKLNMPVVATLTLNMTTDILSKMGKTFKDCKILVNRETDDFMSLFPVDFNTSALENEIKGCVVVNCAEYMSALDNTSKTKPADNEKIETLSDLAKALKSMISQVGEQEEVYKPKVSKNIIEASSIEEALSKISKVVGCDTNSLPKELVQDVINSFPSSVTKNSCSCDGCKGDCKTKKVTPNWSREALIEVIKNEIGIELNPNHDIQYGKEFAIIDINVAKTEIQLVIDKKYNVVKKSIK